MTATLPWSPGTPWKDGTFVSGVNLRGCSASRTTRWRSWSPTASAVEGLEPSRRSGNGRRYPTPNAWRRLRRPFGVSPSEKRMLDLVTDHPMIPREHLATWLGVPRDGSARDAQPRGHLGPGGATGTTGRHPLHPVAEGIRYVTHRDRAELPTTRGIWSTELTTDDQGRTRHLGHRIETWARQTKHADGITWFLSKLEAETRADPDSALQWSYPHRQDRPGLQLGGVGHRPRRRGAPDRPGPSDTLLPRTRASRPPPQGSPCPPGTLHDVLPLQRAGGGPATVPRHGCSSWAPRRSRIPT